MTGWWGDDSPSVSFFSISQSSNNEEFRLLTVFDDLIAFFSPLTGYFYVYNKKVLLRERKRHTDCGVSRTTRGGVPPWPGPMGGGGWVPEVGYPPPPSGYPRPGPMGGGRGYARCGQTD